MVAIENTWTYATCESCLQNAHKEEKMVKRKVISTDEIGQGEDYWVCTKCGFTRRL